MSDLADKLAKFKANAEEQLTKAGETNIDDALLSKLVDNLKLVIDNRDARSVAGSDPSEMETVRTNFVVKKLGINDKDRGTAAVTAVAEKMSGSHNKNRAAFYYLVQKALT
ncbi:MAG: DUF2853 family protein [Gammaproteobacteria bacterium]|nr:DUF2853 family protein [Gammaproteobacteria bacterium]MBT8437322.1 DUF2853 family protein [Gammaproteobacteria bacterium]